MPNLSRPAARTLRVLMVQLAMTTASIALVPGGLTTAFAEEAPATTPADPLAGAELIGEGPVAVFRRGESLFLRIPADSQERPFLWYIEAVGLPAGVIADRIEVGNRLVHFERRGARIFLRDLTVAAANRPAVMGDLAGGERGPGPVTGTADDPAAGTPGGDRGADSYQMSDPKTDPLSAALSIVETGPVLAAFPVLDEGASGIVIDVTATFAGDVGGSSAGSFVALTGQLPQGVDPGRSAITAVRVTGDTIVLRSEVTFLAADPANPASGLAPVSLRLGHSLTFLPDGPMAPRYFDPRVGYFTTSFTQFEDEARGTTVEPREVIARFRLEKADPAAEVSDPVTPVTFWIGPGVPDRWRGAMRAGVMLWEPVLREAGFSNAIRVEDAPAGDADWFVEDAGRNVIRWLPMNHANAMGPHAIDPRSGETLFAHVLVWPAVVDWFSLYYWSLFGTVDPRAAKLPLPLDLQQDLMTYVIAHEVGHTLGLRHNQLASTAWSVAQMRDPAFANVNGPNSSIMAYGRFNQVAQPGDGLTQFWSVIGPYDRAAIRWGYGSFADQTALDAFAAGMAADRATQFGSGEMLDGVAADFFDPRVQTENTGAERIDATRLGTANILRSLANLPRATSDLDLQRQAWKVALETQSGLLLSVVREVGGTYPRHEDDGGPRVGRVAAEDQRSAVDYLLGEGVASLDPYRDPALLERVAVFGAAKAVDLAQVSIIDKLLDASRIALLDSQAAIYPDAYSAIDLGRDTASAVWDDLGPTTRTSRVMQQAWIDANTRLVAGWATAAASEGPAIAAAKRAGLPAPAAALLAETGDDTAYPAWLKDSLPVLADRLSAAAAAAGDERDRLHYSAMQAGVARLAVALQ